MKRAYEVGVSYSYQSLLGYRPALSTSSKLETVISMASSAERVTCDSEIVIEEQR